MSFGRMGMPPYELGWITLTSDAPKTPGQAAYEAYGVVLNGYDAGFRFEGLSEEGKARWERVAQAAIDWYKVHNIVVPHE